ncbi:ATP-binding protein [Colwellia piezophila]|uniref:ATP-binding protein n=1 Tax=Colwellia piezophila TaxID=211668 RepID=UPI00146E9F12|nr:ATP-binding protein [Colwellia piezophila]
MTVTVCSLLFVGVVFVSIDQYSSSDAMYSRINVLARVISSRITAAVIFDDQDTAERILSTLQQDKSVLFACVFIASGELVASYSMDGTVKCPKNNPDKLDYQNDGRLDLFQPINLNEERLGALYLSASTQEIDERLLRFTTIVLAVILFASAIAFLLVMTLQKYITAPLIKLRDITDNISTYGNYDQVLPEAGDDEIGSLYRSFSRMMAQIKLRIAERQRAENTLKQSENKFRTLVQNAPVCIHEIDIEGRFTSMNNTGLKMMGFDDELAILGLVYLNVVCEDDRQNVEALLTEALDGTTSFFEFKSASEKDTRYFSSSLVPIKDEHGQVQRLMGITIDITKNKFNEIALRRAQKMEAIGQLTGGIAHDFNNILGIIMGNLDLLKMTLKGNDDAHILIGKAYKGTLRAADITRHLLRFSRIEAIKTIPINVNSIFENIDELVAKSLTVSIDVQTQLSENLWPVNVDPGDLEDAILNLSLNAKDAMPEGGRLIIETSNKILDDSYVAINPESSRGEFVMISISDDGIGMSEDIIDKVLEPFFTTKDLGSGTGLGLSMVYGFVKRSGGHIKIYSELGEGTTFNIFLPRADSVDKKDVNEVLALTELPRGKETILIVDDENELVDIATKILQSLGYKVLTVANAQQALNVIENNNSVELIFSDIIMPGGMDGYQLADRIHKIDPRYKMLLTSGFTKKRDEQPINDNEYLHKLVTNRLHKPYNRLELAIAVRRILDEST